MVGPAPYPPSTPVAPFRRAFDVAASPYAARNALGIPEGGGGNVSNSGTPSVGQYAKWVTATTIQGVAPATVLSDIGAQPAGSYQPLDADLTAIAALTGTNTIYYRSATNTWAAVTIGTGLAFSSGNLTATVTSGAPVGAEYITSTADATLTSERVLTDTATVTWDRTTAGQIKANATGGGGTVGPPQGRLTLASGTPVMTTTQSAKTTIYYTSYVGEQIGIYNGSSWTMTAFGELSVLTTDTTKSPAAIGASRVNDWFVWNDAGTLRIGHGPDWTNDTTRSAGTALARVNGILLNAVALSNGPAIQRGTYVGTTRSNASSQLQWILGTAAVDGGEAWLGVWNAYNRVDVITRVSDTTVSWTWTNATWRSAKGSVSIDVSWVCGLAEDSFYGCYQATAFNSGSSRYNCAVSYDNATTPSGNIGSASSANSVALRGEYNIPPAIGSHFIYALEYSVASGTTTWTGTSAAGDLSSGLIFSGRF